MIDRHHDGDPLAEEGHHLQVGGVERWGPEDSEVEVARKDATGHLSGGALLEDEAHARVRAQEASEAFRQPARPHGVQEPDSNHPGLGRHRTFGVGDGLAEVGQQPLRPAHEALPRLGEPDRASDALEQGYAHLLLEAGDLAADC